jgi:hypothetical protein
MHAHDLVIRHPLHLGSDALEPKPRALAEAPVANTRRGLVQLRQRLRVRGSGRPLWRRAVGAEP